MSNLILRYRCQVCGEVWAARDLLGVDNTTSHGLRNPDEPMHEDDWLTLRNLGDGVASCPFDDGVVRPTWITTTTEPATSETAS